MATNSRNPAELEADRLLVMSILVGAGKKVKMIELTAAVNAQRISAAKQTCIAMGDDEETAESFSKTRTLTIQTVRRDVRVAQERLRKGSDAAGSAYLDRQLEDIQTEIEKTQTLDEQIFSDMNLSRTEITTITTALEGGEGESVSVRKKGASTGYYAALARNAMLRVKLRAEERMVRFGQSWFANRTEEQRFSQALADIDISDPVKARKAAMLIYDREVAMLKESARQTGPVPPGLVASERLRLTENRARIGAVKDRIQKDRPEMPRNTSDLQPGYTIIVERIEPNTHPAEEEE